MRDGDTPFRMRIVRWIAFSVAGLCYAACSSNLKQNAPGDALGVYSLSADADMTSSCTELLDATPRPWTFSITLRRSSNAGYWVSGGDPIEGTIDDSGSVAFKRSISVDVRPADKVNELGPCTVIRTDDFAGKLAGDPKTPAGVASFTGTLRYSYTVAPGADCRDIVGGAAAPNSSTPHFSVLPCDLRFAITATRTGDAK